MATTGVILARFQPIHNGHLALIDKAFKENDSVLIFIGSVDKINARNPIPWKIRRQLVDESLKDHYTTEELKQIHVRELRDLTDESDNSHEWGFYLFANMVKEVPGNTFTMYYSDGYEIITSWFPGFILYDHLSLKLVARGTCEFGVSATQVRSAILTGESVKLKGWVPEPVYKNRYLIKNFIEAHDSAPYLPN